MADTLVKLEPCRLSTESVSDYRTRLPRIAEAVIDSCSLQECHTHVDYEPIPSRAVVVEIIDRMRELLFPGYFSRDKVDPVTLRYSVGQTVATVFDLLAEQICRSIRHDCLRYHQPCIDCDHRGHDLALQLLEGIPDLRRLLSTDVRATYQGDPAARSHDEIIFSYPGLYATAVYRVAHRLYRMGVPLLPRIMTEHAHSITGIDIHPGAEIDESFVIDHGTGVVIGETTQIGKGVRIYQGVTLGALSLPLAAGDQFRGKKRHPTIEDEVIIYSGATILGGETVIGARAVIGGNVWLTESVPPDTRVVMEAPRLIYKTNGTSVRSTEGELA